MNNNELSMILTVALAISVSIFFVLLIVLLIMTMNKKQKESKEKKSEQIKSTSTQHSEKSKIIQTKAYTPADIKSFMDFDDIKDNMIVQNKGKRFVMVIQCQGVNYDLMSSIEKVSVEQGFIQFLNTLTRPIQLYVQARKVNLEESLQNYNKRFKDIENKYRKLNLQYQDAMKDINMSKDQFNKIKYEYTKQKNLYEYAKDIINNTEKMSLNKNILTKNYYMALSYMPDNTDELYNKDELIDMAFSELYTNAQSLLRVLAVTGVTGKILNSTDLADLLYVAYNRDASEVYGVDKAIKAGYDALYTASQDVFEKKMAALDNLIKERALDMANQTIETVTLENRRRRELEEKENNIRELVKEMAKSMIYENEDYIPKEIIKESVQKIDEDSEKEKEKPKRKKKGAE